LPPWPKPFAPGVAAAFACADAGGTEAPGRGPAAGAAGGRSGGASDQPDKAAAALAPAAAAVAAVAAATGSRDTGGAAASRMPAHWRPCASARACAVPHQGQKFTGRGVGLPQAALMQR
jgi:hypothetical protein